MATTKACVVYLFLWHDMFLSVGCRIFSSSREPACLGELPRDDGGVEGVTVSGAESDGYMASMGYRTWPHSVGYEWMNSQSASNVSLS